MIVLALVISCVSPDPVDDRDDPTWSARPLRRPGVGQNQTIDTLLDRARDGSGVTSAPEADRVTLIRRLSFSLRGLPPSPAEIDAFEADARLDAYERLVDTYLASPDFGVRWAGRWLDIARYADSAGFEDDARRPDAWRYRDWIVDAINSDLPYDRFIAFQLAADEVAPEAPRQRAALGFLRAGPAVGNQRGDRVRADELDDVVVATSSAFLGLTVGCGRCHDHKSDPIPTEDYYRLAAIFAPSRSAEVSLATDDETGQVRETDRALEEVADIARDERLSLVRPVRARLETDHLARLPAAWRVAVDSGRLGTLRPTDRAEVASRMEVTPPEIDAALGPIEKSAVAEADARVDRITALKPARPDKAPGVLETTPRAAPTYILIRGEASRPGPPVRPGPPRMINGDVVDFPDPPPSARSTGRRSALAAWIVGPAASLVARVEVDRIWRGHFGVGLVGTPGDFGRGGEPPALPSLLDALASELIEGGWSRKPIHRRIVLSSVYRQSSRPREAMRRLDPRERLLWRHSPHRLEAEAIRDAILASAGTLNQARGGPGVFPPIDPAVVRTGNLPRWPIDARDGPEVWRRSLYLFRMRSVPFPLLEALDLPDPSRPCPERSVTTGPIQALALLNDPFVVSQSHQMAARIGREAGPSPDSRIDLAFRLTTGRPPTTDQRADVRAYLDGPGDLAGLALALFNSAAFVHVE